MEPLRLADWRRRRFLSQDELAKESGVSKRAIVALESDEPPKPQGRTVRKLAAALGLEPADLYRLPQEGE
jgi:DNA-binding XRE family transcriptional regulator